MTQNLKNLIITVTLEKSFTTSIYLCSSAFLIKWEEKLTVYGIETNTQKILQNFLLHVATVLTVYGIETYARIQQLDLGYYFVATVLTVYGIETICRTFCKKI